MKGFQEIDSTLDKTYEYVFTPVPMENRKPTSQLVLILTGFAFSSSGLATGGTVGTAWSFADAAGICFLGNLILFAVALFWGLQGYQSGDTSIFRIKKELGEWTGKIFAVVILSAMIIWIGMNGELLARFMVGTFPGWPLPVSVTAFLIIATTIFSARNGWKSLEHLSYVLVPFIVLMVFITVVQTGKISSGFSFITSYKPMEEISFLTSVAMVAGNFAMSAVMMADICRFAKNRRSVVLCISVYIAVLMLNDLTGIMIVQATGSHNLNYGLYLLGTVPRSLLWLIFCGFTTQSVNLYVGSLAIQSLLRKTVMAGNISYKTAAYFVGSAAVIVAVVGFRKSFQTFTGLLIGIVISLTVVLAWRKKT